MSRHGRNWRRLIHRLNQRYRAEFDRAERLQAELRDIQGSRLWKGLALLRALRQRLLSLFRSRPQPIQGSESVRLSCNLPQKTRTNLVSIIIPFKDDVALLASCLRSIRRSSYPQREVILVDNGSRKRQTRCFLDRWQQRGEGKLLGRPAPFNFSWLCNEGAIAAHGSVLLFLNNDTEVLHGDWLEQMLAVLELPQIGIVGATLFYPDSTLQHAGLIPTAAGWAHVHRGQPAAWSGENGELRQVRTVPAVTGACLMIHRGLFEELGGFSEAYPVTMNDVDLCQRAARAGWRTAITPHAQLLHYESLARGHSLEQASCSTG